MANLMQVESDRWVNEDGSLTVFLEDGRYSVCDEDGERANIGAWERVQRFVDLISD